MLITIQNKKNVGPVPASGVHAELLEDMKLMANDLLIWIERERSGQYDGVGSFWVGRDPVLNATQKLVELAHRRAGEARDAGLRG